MRMKYIVVSFQHEHAGPVIAPILFPDVINHVDMFANMRRPPYRAELVSAGFVSLATIKGDDYVTAHCYGESESLSSYGENAKSRGEDDMLLVELQSQGWTCCTPAFFARMKEHRAQYPRK